MTSIKKPGSIANRAVTTGTYVASTGAADASYDKLKEYEARRRLAYTTKLDAMSLRWRSYRDLLSASLSETSRAQRLILGTCRAHKVYSDALSAMYHDTYLDEKGEITKTDRQQKKLAASRKTEFRLKTRTTTTKTKSSGDEESKTDQTETTQTPIVKEIRDAQHDIASKIGENARNMDNEIAAEVGSLLDNLKQQFTQMEQLGTSMLSELEKTEQEVVSSWGKYRNNGDNNTHCVHFQSTSSRRRMLNNDSSRCFYLF